MMGWGMVGWGKIRWSMLGWDLVGRGMDGRGMVGFGNGELGPGGIRVRRFRQKKFFVSKQNEAKRDPFRMRFARSREKKQHFFSLLFASFRFEFFASDQSEINRAYFCFVLLK